MTAGRLPLLGLFARHPTAANLLMAVMIVAGLLSIDRLNTQFFPDFGIDVITVSVAWPGASPGDVESNIVSVLEPELRFIDGVKKLMSTAREGIGWMVIEFKPDAEMQVALSAVENAVAQVTNLPEDAEEPRIQRVVRYDTIARLVVSGPYPEASLKNIAKRIREQLLARGIDKVTLFGARDEEIWVEIEPETLLRLDLTLDEVAARISETNRDLPSGDTRGPAQGQIRSMGMMRSARELAALEVRALDGGEKILLGDIATVAERFEDGVAAGWLDGAPAVDLHIQRAVGIDALQQAAVVDQFLADLTPRLPANLRVEKYDVAASLIRERINLLLRNGATGLVLVLAVLFLFLNARVAIWIAVGIPVAVMAALAVMLATGQSINMVSLFALIMMLGIIVDDAIVVGEHAMARRSAGMSPLDAAETGARRMTAPVFSATLTTIAAFLPVILISGIIGEVIEAIPLVVVAVLIASLIECFLVLPGHMRGALAGDIDKVSRFRRGFNAKFERFRDGPFRRFVALCVSWRYATLGVSVASLILAVGLLIGGRVQFVFFPSPESSVVFANFTFAPGTPRDRTEAMLVELVRAMKAADARLSGAGPSVIRLAFGALGAPIGDFGARFTNRGDHVGGVKLELIPSERRDVRTDQMIEAWRQEIRSPAGLESLTIEERRGGLPGRDLDIRLSGGEARDLKTAALETRDLLGQFAGVSDIADDLPWGKQEHILTVTPRGRALGFTTESVGRQLRDAFEGVVAQRFARGDEEIAVRVQLPRSAIGASALRDLYLRGPGGAEVPLSEVVAVGQGRGFALIRRQDGRREVSITAEIDESVTNPGELIAALRTSSLAQIAARHGLDLRFAGKAEEQGETLADMRTGTKIGLAAIYIILAWVFASYTRPLVVMAIIPFALVGAIAGHWLLGYDLTILSLIGLLGLSGIVVNDSIILVSTIDERLGTGQALSAAIVDGACDRLRAVILTSLTTIGGLVPLLSETSLQAQFLKPMALSLVFGLIATTALVLIVVPSLLRVMADFRRPWARSRTPEAGHEQDQNREQLEAAE
ncbi:MAG: efflux RND transporter permease subunit [Alphaproteobacteria bacterium]|nr:efflux RND transporter permease subunit [Alphaproteobacteria bacterium]